MSEAAQRHSEALWSSIPTTAILFTYCINLPYFLRPSPTTITIPSEALQQPPTLSVRSNPQGSFGWDKATKRGCVHPSVILSICQAFCQAFDFRPTRSDLWPCIHFVHTVSTIQPCFHTYKTILCPMPFSILDCKVHCCSLWNWYTTGKNALLHAKSTTTRNCPCNSTGGFLDGKWHWTQNSITSKKNL